MTTATIDARSVVQSFYAHLAGGKPDAAFALFSDDIEWNEAESNPLADRNPYRGVKQIAEGFRVSATAPDGVIEAIEDPAARFCLGVQWHPENFWRTGEFRPLFEGFLEAATKRP